MIILYNHTPFRIYLHRGVTIAPRSPGSVTVEHWQFAGALPAIAAAVSSGELEIRSGAEPSRAEPSPVKVKGWRQPSRAEIEACTDVDALNAWIGKGLSGPKAGAALDRLDVLNGAGEEE